MAEDTKETERERLDVRIRQLAAQPASAAWLTLLDSDGELAQLTYSDLVGEAWRWTEAYRGRGLTVGTRIVIVLDHSVDLYAAHCGALLGGYVPVIFSPPSPKQDIDFYYRSLKAQVFNANGKLVVTTPEFEAAIRARPVLDEGRAILTQSAVSVSAKPAPFAGTPEDTAILQYSSGTTGRKKGVCFSHRAVSWQIANYARAIGLGGNDRIVTWLPLYHDMGFVACYLMPLLTGVPVVAMSPFDWVKRPAMLLEAIEAYKTTLCWQPNFAYNFLARNVSPDRRYDLSSMRGFVNCSEPVAAASHRLFLERFAGEGVREEALAASYAMAENVFAVTAGGLGRPMTVDRVDARILREEHRAEPAGPETTDVREIVSSGTPLPRTEIRVVNPRRQLRRKRALGEIAVKSPSLFRKYFRNPDETQKRLVDGWYFTGDLGYITDSEVFVLGRVNDMINIGGKNIFPEDIEATVSLVPGIVPGRCAALGIVDEELGTQKLAVIAETMESDPMARDRLRDEVRAAIVARNDVAVHDVLIVAHMWLVKSTSGKISRSANLERYFDLIAERATEYAVRADSAAPADPMTAAVLAVLHDALGSQIGPFAAEIGAETRLISSGMIDSLSVATLLAALESRFAVTLPDEMAQDLSRLDSATLIADALTRLGADPARTASVPAATARRDWHERLSRQVTAWNERVVEIAPQLLDVEALGGQAFGVAVADHLGQGRGYASRANYRSRSLNTDDNGFRWTLIDGAPIDLDAFRARPGPRGYILGSSSSFGVGTSSDAAVFANRLNERSGADGLKWHNLSLRGSNFETELKAIGLLDGAAADRLLAFSGLNDFRLTADLLTALEAARGKDLSDSEIEETYAKLLDGLAASLEKFATLASGLGARPEFWLQLGMPALARPKALAPEEERLRDEMRLSRSASFGDYWMVPKYFDSLVHRFRADLARLCRERAIPFHDPNGIERFAGPEWLFNDYWHYTDAGHAILADLIAATLGD